MQIASYRSGNGANRDQVTRGLLCVTRFAHLGDVFCAVIYATVLVIVLFSFARGSLWIS
jgi:hypothetical protein